MNQKEKDKLCALINLANKGLPGYRTNSEFIAECLQEAELHFDYPNCYSFNQNRQVIRNGMVCGQKNAGSENHLQVCRGNPSPAVRRIIKSTGNEKRVGS
ncbi:MAG: hypothetical protein PUG90_02185 [Clostridia bacterium]|nr:hypothetical protein [Clostridia bacterium]